MPENFVYGVDFTDERECPVKPGMTRKLFVMFAKANICWMDVHRSSPPRG